MSKESGIYPASKSKFDLEDIFKIENLTCDNVDYVSQINKDDLEVFQMFTRI